MQINLYKVAKINCEKSREITSSLYSKKITIEQYENEPLELVLCSEEEENLKIEGEKKEDKLQDILDQLQILIDKYD